VISNFRIPEILRSAQDDKLRLSLDHGQLLQVNALEPPLQFAGILVLQFYLDEIAVGNHHPTEQRALCLFRMFRNRACIDVHRFGVAFAGVAVALPRFGRSADIIRVRKLNRGC